MEALKELKELGGTLGYIGPQLQNLIKEQQLIQRDERAVVRQKEEELIFFIIQEGTQNFDFNPRWEFSAVCYKV